MARGIRIVDKDRGYKKLVKRLSTQGAPIVTVGIHGSDGDREHPKTEGLTVADVGAFHEFGLGVPRRSFLVDWADENQAENARVLRVLAQAVAKGKVASNEQALQRFGVYAVGSIQKRMADGIPPPLSPITIRIKGSSVPLIDTGQLRSSITFKIEKEDKE